jgi:MoaA/NifB/PqqE/SkfB family radical SAM enzyme
MSVTETASLYGRWNALLVDGSDHAPSWTWAHDGDFFPESPLDYVEAFRSAIQRKDYELRQPLPPVRVDIDITQVCNARCTFCFSRPYQTEQYHKATIRAPMLKGLFRRLNELGTRTVRFCGGGEPFVHPEIDSLLPLPHEHGLAFCIISNLDLVDDRRAHQISEHVDHLRWSVNAGSDRTRLAIHRPSRGAGLLSESFLRVERMIQRRANAQHKRTPLVWATYLILPENVHEIIDCAKQLRSIGVDSVSFRPVFHGLHTIWSPRARAVLHDALLAVEDLGQAREFYVFTPKRDATDVETLVPAEHFDLCLSRKVRTVLEATEEGAALQSCGTYRGTGARIGHTLATSDEFIDLWSRFQRFPSPIEAPRQCDQCIDISINRTLTFIVEILKRNAAARFRRAYVDTASNFVGAVE